MILFLTFLVANHFFPQYVQIDGWPTMILATVLFYVAEYIIAFVLVLAMMGVISFSLLTDSISVGQVLAIIALVVALCFVGMMSILVLSKYLPGFWVSGKMTAFILALIPSLLSAKVTTSNRN